MNCPNCQSDEKITEQNYGALYTCGSCKSVYFIGFDGQPEFGEASSEEYEAAQEEQHQAHQQEQQLLQESVESLSVESSLADNFTNQPEQSFNSESSESLSNELSFPDSGLDPIMSVTESLEAVSEDSFLSEPVSGNAFADVAREISNFGNTESQIAGMNYDLVISGIDTQEARNLLKEALEDSKFGWDAAEIMKTIKNGRIELLRLNPAKAFVLAKRIQFLDANKHWKQNVLS